MVAGQVDGRADEAVAGRAAVDKRCGGRAGGRGQAMLVRIGVDNRALG